MEQELEKLLIWLKWLADWQNLWAKIWVKLTNSIIRWKITLFWWFEEQIYFWHLEEHLDKITKKFIRESLLSITDISDARFIVLMVQKYKWEEPAIVWIDLVNKVNPKITRFSIDTEWTYNLEENDTIYKNRTLVEQLIELSKDLWWWERALKVRYLKTFFEKQRLTEAFYKTYKTELFDRIKRDLIRKFWKDNEEDINNFVLVNLNRLLFIHFLDRKWTVFKDYNKKYWSYISYLFHKVYKELNSSEQFYNSVLKPLFFETFNKPYSQRTYKSPILKQEFWDLPYLNGWLFKQSKYEKDSYYMDNAFIKSFILNIIDAYNFTIKEDTPFDVKVSVDPELLWYIFENLIQEYDTQSDDEDTWKSKKKSERDDSWVFYTPKIEVDFMCRQVLIEYLSKKEDLQNKKVDLYKLFYDEKWWIDNQEYGSFTSKEIAAIFKYLSEIKVVDPACWSWAFLVWMMQVILSVEQKLIETNDAIIRLSVTPWIKEFREMTEFQRKKKLIKNSLYWVDIKQWAVEIAKLRLWLSMIIDVKEDTFERENVKNEPLLPSFWFHIVQWDSVVNRIWDKLIPLNVARKDILDKTTRDKIEKLVDLKNKFYDNEKIEIKTEVWLDSLLEWWSIKMDEQYIKLQEKEIYEEMISNKIKYFRWKVTELENQKSQRAWGFNSTLFWSVELWWWFTDEKVKNKRIDKEIEEYNIQIESLQKQLWEIKWTWTVPFSWWIDFADVFTEKGWFDVVVWNPPYIAYKKIWDANGQLSDEVYKKYLKESTYNDYKKWAFNIDGKSDFYIYFYYKSIALLNISWVMTFISSNMRFDTQYWADFQSFLCKNFSWWNIKVFDSSQKTFKSADLNSNIIFIPKDSYGKDFTDSIYFCMFKKPYDESIYSESFLLIEEKWMADYEDEDLIFHGKSWEELYEMWVDESDWLLWKYKWKKWSNEFFRSKWKIDNIIEKASWKLIAIKNIKYIDVSTWIKEWWFKKYLKENSDLKNLKVLWNVKKHNSINIDIFDSVVDEPKYVEKFKKKTANLLLISARWLTHKFHYNPDNYSFTWNYIGLNCTDDNKIQDVLLLFNSTFFILVTELWARNKWIGGAAIVMNKMDLLEVNVPNPDLFSFDKSKFKNFCSRTILTIFEELWFNKDKDIRSQTPNPLPDRKELDDIVFDKLWLTQEERNEIYWSLGELVKARVDKANSI